MRRYSCIEQAIRSYGCALTRRQRWVVCRHPRETTSQFASDPVSASCHHDTWLVARVDRVSEHRHARDLSWEAARSKPEGREPIHNGIQRLLYIADAAVAEVDELPAGCAP